MEVPDIAEAAAWDTDYIVAALRDIRKAKGLSQAQVAQRAGIARQHLSILESGRVPYTSLWTLAALARACGVTVFDVAEQAAQRQGEVQ